MTKLKSDRQRAQRLARALRENLKRRKAQARARHAPAAQNSGPGAAPEDKKED